MSYLSEYDALESAATEPEALHATGAAAARPFATWLVLARRTYEEPLHEIGAVEADDPDLARMYARSIYDEFAWIEMVIVPRSAALTVIAS